MNPSITHIKELFPKTDKGVGATIAFTAESGFLKLGVAFCSNRDQYNRKRGRAIAEGRYNKRPFIINVTGLSEKSRKEMIEIAIQKAQEIHSSMCAGRDSVSLGDLVERV